LNPYDEAIW